MQWKLSHKVLCYSPSYLQHSGLKFKKILFKNITKLCKDSDKEEGLQQK